MLIILLQLLIYYLSCYHMDTKWQSYHFFLATVPLYVIVWPFRLLADFTLHCDVPFLGNYNHRIRMTLLLCHHILYCFRSFPSLKELLYSYICCLSNCKTIFITCLHQNLELFSSVKLAFYFEFRLNTCICGVISRYKKTSWSSYQTLLRSIQSEFKCIQLSTSWKIVIVLNTRLLLY